MEEALARAAAHVLVEASALATAKRWARELALAKAAGSVPTTALESEEAPAHALARALETGWALERGMGLVWRWAAPWDGAWVGLKAVPWAGASAAKKAGG